MNFIFGVKESTITLILIIIFGTIGAILLTQVFFGHLWSSDYAEKKMEIENASCEQLMVIYLNENGGLHMINDSFFKKHFKIKCIDNQPLEVVP